MIRKLMIPLALALILCGQAWAADAPFDPQAATDAYLATLSQAARHKSDAYFEGGYWLILWNALYSLAVCALLLQTRLSATLRSLAFRIGRRRIPAHALYGVFYSLVTALLTLPLDIYQGFFREHQYGLSNQTFAAWGTDALIGLAVGLVVAAIMLPIIYAVIRAAPGRWWLWCTGVVVAFMAVVLVLGPVFLEPLFNHFQPLAEGPLRTAILSMAHADGIPAQNVMEFDNSRQTDRISAHVSGLFGTTQISLNDNLIRQCTQDEVLAVLGHEMGHYVMGHILTFVLSLSLIVAAGLALARWGLRASLARFGTVWGITAPDDIAGLPILAAILTAFLFVLTPLTNTLTRTQEMQADIFGLNLARRPDAFSTVALKLSTYRKLSPTPLEEFLFFDHPSGRTRIFTAMRWKAAELGK